MSHSSCKQRRRGKSDSLVQAAHVSTAGANSVETGERDDLMLQPTSPQQVRAAPERREGLSGVAAYVSTAAADRIDMAGRVLPRLRSGGCGTWFGLKDICRRSRIYVLFACGGMGVDEVNVSRCCQDGDGLLLPR